jgi:serine/threonine protein kinase
MQGSLLYDMLTGKPPFYSTNKNDILKKITTKPVPIPEDLSPDAKSLLKALFKIRPKERLGYLKDAAEIKSHPFFANVNFEQVLLREVEAPISFKEALNNEGFDLDFNNNSYESTINLDRTMKEKGLIFDGFTYYKPEISPTRKKSAE